MIREQRIGGEEAHWLRLIPSCESDWNPSSEEDALGLYQFKRPTWESTPFGNRDVLDAYWNTRGAAWGYLHLEHGKYEWQCTGELGLG